MNPKMLTIKGKSLLSLATAWGVVLMSKASAFALDVGDRPDVIVAQETDLRSLVLTIVNYFLGFLGLIAVIMVIYGGVTYVVSAGGDEAVGKAKKIIMYALIGLIIVLLSFVLVNAVLGVEAGA